MQGLRPFLIAQSSAHIREEVGIKTQMLEDTCFFGAEVSNFLYSIMKKKVLQVYCLLGTTGPETVYKYLVYI